MITRFNSIATKHNLNIEEWHVLLIICLAFPFIISLSWVTPARRCTLSLPWLSLLLDVNVSPRSKPIIFSPFSRLSLRLGEYDRLPAGHFFFSFSLELLVQEINTNYKVVNVRSTVGCQTSSNLSWSFSW